MIGSKNYFVLCTVILLCIISQGCGPNGIFPTTGQTRAQQLQTLQMDYNLGLAAVNTALAVGQVNAKTVQDAQVVMDAIEAAISKAQSDLTTNPDQSVWAADISTIETEIVKITPLFRKAKSTRTTPLIPSSVTKPISN